MSRYVALLRGINVSGRNSVAMVDLRDLFDSLGYREVTTFIQSGNLIFKAPKVPDSSNLEQAVAERFGIETSVMLRSSSELNRIVQSNPFASADPSRLHVGFMAAKPGPAAVRALEPAAFDPEQFSIAENNVYMHLPNGMARTKLPAYLDRKLKVASTIRNWNTVTKLLELSVS